MRVLYVFINNFNFCTLGCRSNLSCVHDISSNCRVLENIGLLSKLNRNNTRDQSEKHGIGMLLGHDAAVDESGSTTSTTSTTAVRDELGRWKLRLFLIIPV